MDVMEVCCFTYGMCTHVVIELIETKMCIPTRSDLYFLEEREKPEYPEKNLVEGEGENQQQSQPT